MEQLEHVAGRLGGFGLSVREIAKNHDRFLVAKSGSLLRVVIKKWAGKWAPIFRVRDRELESRSCSMYLQATALWRWSNYLQQLDLEQKIRVLINVDETSVRLVPEEGKGHQVSSSFHVL